MQDLQMSLTLLSDRYESEYPSLVREVLDHSSSETLVSARLAEGGFCGLICHKVLFVWNYDSDSEDLPHAFRLSLPSTGLQYGARNVCFYKQTSKKMPSVLAVSPEGCIRHWSEIGNPHKDINVDLQNEVSHSIVLFEAKVHVHRFIFSTTTSTFYLVEVFHDDRRAEHLVVRPLDMNTHVGIGKRMSVLLFGNPSIDRETVVKVVPVEGEVNVHNAELMVIFHKVIRFYSVSQSSHLFAIETHDLVVRALEKLGKLTDNLKHYLLDAVPYNSGFLVLISVNSLKHDCLDFYLGYVNGDTSKTRQFIAFNQLSIPIRYRMQAPIHTVSLPVVRLHTPEQKECIVVFNKFIVHIDNPEGDADSRVLESVEERVIGSETIDGLCHIVLKDSGVCALRKLPRDFDLLFYKRTKKALQIIYEDFMGKDFSQLKSAFLIFASKDLYETEQLFGPLKDLEDEAIASLVLQFVFKFVDHEPINDPRWRGETGLVHFEQNPAVVILSQLNGKLAFFKMFFLFLNYFKVTNQIDVRIPETKERTAKTVFLELGEKLRSMIALFKLLTSSEMPVVSGTVQQLAKVFKTQFDHPSNRNLTAYDHFFKEVSHFEEFIPELVKLESEELDQCPQDYLTRAQVVTEVGTALTKIYQVVVETREMSTRFDNQTLTWMNEPKLLKYIDKHLNFAVGLLRKEDAQLTEMNLNVLLNQVIVLTRLLYNGYDKNKRISCTIISQLYENGQQEEALKLAEEFQDFNLIIKHSHTALSDGDRKNYIAQMKEKFQGKDFDLILYDYYRKNGMVEYLLEEKGERLENFLRSHENINWIRNIEKKQYRKARNFLKNMMMETENASKKGTIAALGTLCALCEDEENATEIAEFTEVMKIVEHQEAIDSVVLKRINPRNRPMKVKDIIDAYLQEDDCRGFMKALIMVASLRASTISPIERKQSDEFVKHIYKKILASDEWIKLSVDPVQFEVKAQCSKLATVLHSVFELGIADNEKKALLPNVDDVDKLIELDHHRSDLLKRFLSSEISNVNFCLDKDTQMED
uniref:Nuclear pore complex protein Nup133 n=1 Tax=Bursaphelenchus xylophilus TaxID=6326 RepID=A0A1I7RQW8_BURXY